MIVKKNPENQKDTNPTKTQQPLKKNKESTTTVKKKIKKA